MIRIGMTVNNLRKSSNDEEMITVAKTLIKTWKKFVPENDTKKPAVKEDSREREEKKSEKQSKSVASSRPSFSGDEVRSRCRDLLLSAIKGSETPEGIDDDKCEELATMIEDEINQLHKNNQMKYKNQVRSRVFNLRDKKNPMLRGNFLLGLITPAQ